MVGTRCETTWVWVVMVVVVVILAAAMAAVVEGVGSPEPELEALRDERGGLVALRDALRSGRDLHSNWTGPPCHGGRSRWYGVACDGDGRVVGVQLDGSQLTGALPAGALAGVARLETLSLRDNAIHGALPRLDALARLRVVDLSSNRFSGPIPRGYAAALGELERLELQDNLINGTLPAFDQDGLAVFNVSYNFLQGEVPDTRALRRFPATAFAHNLRLCGEVVRTECRRESSPFDAAPAGGGGSGSDGGDRVFGARDAAAPPARWRKPIRFRIARWSVVVIALIAALVPFAAVLIFLHHSKKSRVVRLGGGRAAAAAAATAGDIKDKAAEQAGNNKVSSGSGSGSRSTTESGKGAADQLQFFRPEKATFSLDELFRSTAEMLGKGRLGITYRVALHAGGGPVVVVVKRLRNMGHVPRKDFAHTMQLLGKLRHENVVEVVACYFSKDEKLVVYDHVPGRSLFHLLHAKGVARGLAYLHQTLPLFHRPPHGNLKSTNVLVVFPAPGSRRGGGGDAAPVAKLTDYGFHPLLPHHAHRLAAAKCPELARGRRRLSSRADVFCLGLVLLEVVTGKVPVDEDGDLAEWARLALSHEWSTDILDVEIVADRGRHGDMLRLTEVALLCAAVDPERRPKAHDVVRMIDEIAAGSAAAAGDGEATAGRELALR
uniref:Protein kinase domain-containing protein n=1 Tax=Oryza glumipatula TaxID=40148 RepID=A0A0E0BC42_9ORYZ